MKVRKKYIDPNFGYSAIPGESINEFDHLDTETMINSSVSSPLTIDAQNNLNPERFETPFQNVPDFDTTSENPEP